MRRPILHGVRSFARVIVLLLAAIVALHGAVLAQPAPMASPTAVAEWRKFRQVAPDHFQDWIMAGDGPRFTLIYSEPPPTFTESQYRDLFARVFRGLTAVSLQSRPLGYNGRTIDFVLELNYSFAGASATSAVDEDLNSLSIAIYGTASGGRAIRLKDLIERPPATSAPKSIAMSAMLLDSWLFAGNGALEFLSPESGTKKTLSQLMSGEKSGRYISVDNSLVVMLVDLTRSLNGSDITNARLFALDGDLILGGAVDNGKSVAIVARARQESWIDFPPLRVEDIINLMVTKNDALAQSYDRTFPGAGRVSGKRDDVGDWAPNYLSADLINTEFGSLLNRADAILKSQSLSNTIKYDGYDVQPIKNPPYKKGVFTRLQATSLIFNFNTVGTGHWFVGANRRIFAQNRTGSFSVTYLPEATGRSSTISGSAAVAQAERDYTAWFDAANSKVLTRTVQYLAIYEIFQNARLQGIDAYTDRQKTFDSIGASLKQALAEQLRSCIDELTAKDTKFLDAIAADYRSLALQSGLDASDARPPSSKEDWVTRASRASVAMRYDANLTGGTSKLLNQQIKALVSQAQNLRPAYLKDERELLALQDYILDYYGTRYKHYEKTDTIGRRTTEYEITYPPDRTKFERDKARFYALYNKFLSEQNALQATAKEINKLSQKRIEALAPEFGDMVVVEVIANSCNQKYVGFKYALLDGFKAGSATITAPSDVFSSVKTPTIVKSRNKLEEFVGGHNVDRQHYLVEIDNSLSKGQFVSADGKLRISAGDSDHMNDIAASMARVADADADTQGRTFAEAIATPHAANFDRRAALDIPPAGDRSDQGRTVEATSVGVAALAPTDARLPIGGPNAMRIGRQESGGHLYFEEIANNATQPVAVYGAYGMPSIIEGRAQGRPSMTVMLDSSLSARDVDAIIANYKNAGPQVQAGGGGGGWRIPPGDRIELVPDPKQPAGPIPPSGGTPSNPQRPGARKPPLLVLFIDEGTGRKRTIVETENGRIELEVSKELRNEEILKLIEQEIERGAALQLDATKTYVNGRGAVLLVTGFKIEQSKAISGDFVAKRQGLVKFDGGIIGRLRSAMVAAFSRMTGKTGEPPARIIDYLVDVKARLKQDAPDYELSGRLDMTRGGLRFVLRLDRLQSKNGS
jgi:hypothetical protein